MNNIEVIGTTQVLKDAGGRTSSSRSDCESSLSQSVTILQRKSDFPELKTDIEALRTSMKSEFRRA